MTGLEHYVEAERLLGAVGGAKGLLTDDGVPQVASDLIAVAQVHATLALVAATIETAVATGTGLVSPVWTDITAVHAQ